MSEGIRPSSAATSSRRRLDTYLEFARKSVQWLTRTREVLDVFVYSPGREIPDEADFVSYDSTRMPPRPILAQLAPLHGNSFLFHIVMRRLRLGQAMLTCAMEGDQVLGFGWFFYGAFFRRKYGWLAPDGIMAAFQWIAPSARGQGLYGRLLLQQIRRSPGNGRLPVVGCASPENTASQRGLRKTNFHRVGRYEFVRWFGGLSLRVRLLERDRDLADILGMPTDAAAG